MVNWLERVTGEAKTIPHEEAEELAKAEEGK